MNMKDRFPDRIVCLTEETTETLYLLGEQDRIVGISGYTVRPPEARKQKPKVSAFLNAKTDKIVELQPDLILGFSDLQADIAAELIREGLNVVVFNQRTVQEILDMVVMLGSMVGAQEKALALVAELETGMEKTQRAAEAIASKPRVYFEEWDDPMISGIQWVSELIELAGGEDCFPELAGAANGSDRIVHKFDETVKRNPDIIIGSWCGKKFRPERVAARPGWQEISAVRNGQLFEIKSSLILQPGPAALTDGLKELSKIILNWKQMQQERN